MWREDDWKKAYVLFRPPEGMQLPADEEDTAAAAAEGGEEGGGMLQQLLAARGLTAGEPTPASTQAAPEGENIVLP